MNYGFMGKILRVDLSQGRVSAEPIRDDWAQRFLGGAGLATKYLYEEAPRGADPLGPANVLIFMTGPLTGTASASASRYSVVAISPLTGIWGHANSGGTFGPVLKRSGFDGIIFEGISPKPVFLRIIDGEAELCDAGSVWGRTVSETQDWIQAACPTRLTIASIGPAGENLVRYAAIINNGHSAEGRRPGGHLSPGGRRVTAQVAAGRPFPAQILRADISTTEEAQQCP